MSNYESHDQPIRITNVIKHLESIAPLAYQESYDNAGLIVGDASAVVSGVLIALDCIEAVIDEAIAKNCNLVVAHHPIIFRGLKKLNGKNYIERTVIKAIKNDIAIYAIHTNLDNISGGVSTFIAEKLNLQNVRILATKVGLLSKLVSFIPKDHTQNVLNALYEAGVGQIGNYDHCSFSVNGKGTFRPNSNASPFIGQTNIDKTVHEDRIEVIFPSYLEHKVVATLQNTHPYEEVAFYVSALNNQNQEVGAGAIGSLPEPILTTDFLKFLKSQFQLSVIKHTAIIKKEIHTVAVCGGSGGFLLNDAIRAKADVFITADYKYHDFFDADNQIIICDIGHYESEVCTKELLHKILSKKFITFASILSETNTNPVLYF